MTQVDRSGVPLASKNTATPILESEPASSASSGLAQTLGARHVTMIALGGIMGAGLFVGSSSALAVGGPAIALTYTAIGLVIFLIMRMLGEMAVAAPGRGSFAEYSAMALGDWAGFATRWFYWWSWIFTVGAETVVGGDLMHQLGFPVPIWLTGIGLVTLMSALNFLHVRAYGELEFWFASVKVYAVIAFIAVGAAYIGVFPHRAVQNIVGHGGVMPFGITGLLAAVPMAIFSMYGSEISTIAAAESTDPVGNVTRTGRSISLQTLAFFVLSIVVTIAIVPWSSLAPGSSLFKSALDAVGIPGSGVMMAIVVITAVLSCLSSSIYITSRMLYELARTGGAPRILAMTTKHQVPTVGVLIALLFGCGAAVAQVYMRQDVFSLLASTSGDIILPVYIIIAAAQIRFRWKLERSGTELRLKMWLFPWLSYGVIAVMVGVLVLLAFLPQERLTLALTGVPVVVVAIVLGLRKCLGVRGGATSDAACADDN